MKTAVCFSGQGRAAEYTYQNIQTHLLDELGDVDTFFHICDDENAHKIEKYFNPTSLLIEEDEYVNPENYIFYHGIRGTKLQYLHMVKSRQRVNELRIEYEQNNNVKYDCVISSRIDVKYFTPFRGMKNLDLNTLYVPDFHCFNGVQGKGYNDRFALGSSEKMNIYFSLFDKLQHYCSLGHRIHGESTLCFHLSHYNIEVNHLPFRFTRVREGGNEIDSRLRAPRATWGHIDR